MPLTKSTQLTLKAIPTIRFSVEINDIDALYGIRIRLVRESGSAARRIKDSRMKFNCVLDAFREI